MMRSFIAWLLCGIATVLDELAWRCWNLALKYEDFDSMKTLDELIEEFDISEVPTVTSLQEAWKFWDNPEDDYYNDL